MENRETYTLADSFYIQKTDGLILILIVFCLLQPDKNNNPVKSNYKSCTSDHEDL